MSSFYCEKCGRMCGDTDHGYVSGCIHYRPDNCPDCHSRDLAQQDEVAVCRKCGRRIPLTADAEAE